MLLFWELPDAQTSLFCAFGKAGVKPLFSIWAALELNERFRGLNGRCRSSLPTQGPRALHYGDSVRGGGFWSDQQKHVREWEPRTCPVPWTVVSWISRWRVFISSFTDSYRRWFSGWANRILGVKARQMSKGGCSHEGRALLMGKELCLSHIMLSL